MRFFSITALIISLVAMSAAAYAEPNSSNTGCTIAQVMKTVHAAKKKYAKYEYASNYAGEQGPPTQKQNENNDQYVFWVDNNGNTYPAVVTYDSGKCTDGKAFVNEKAGE